MKRFKKGLILAMVVVLSSQVFSYGLGEALEENESTPIVIEMPETSDESQQLDDTTTSDEDVDELSSDSEKTDEAEQEPVVEKVLNEDGYELLESYEMILPEGLILDLAYTDYWINQHYVVVLSGGVNIRSGPSTNNSVVRKGYYGQKFSLVETVRGQYFTKSDSDQWYHIFWWNNGEKVDGYVYAPIVRQREFRFDQMFESVTDLKVAVDATDSAYVYNVGNSVGRAPRYNGVSSVDAYGVPQYQAAPGYLAPDWDSSNMRYLQDGILLAILEETDQFYKVNAYDYEGEYYVPKKYVTRKNSIQALNQAIVVDIANQNEGIFEYRDGLWHLISYTYATTGADTKYKEPTIPGSYQVINKQTYFRYKDDVTKVIAGYAPWALRFNGGAFIHGVPVNYKLVKENVVVEEAVLDEEGNVVKDAVTEERIVDRIDPGHIEYMGSLGTIPLSHKCVRNITSHAKFLYDWAKLGEVSVVVID